MKNLCYQSVILFLFVLSAFNYPISSCDPAFSQPKKNQAMEVRILKADIAMAKEVIQKNTMSIPGFGVGSRVNVSSGAFSEADALVIYLLKFHQSSKICPPIAVVAETLKKLKDTKVHKKAVSIFWLDYSTSSNLNESISQSNFVRDSFEWFILTKQTERLKISNARLQGFVGSDEAWRRAMNSQYQSWQKSTSREEEYILKRDAYRAILDAEAAVNAAERAVSSGY